MRLRNMLEMCLVFFRNLSLSILINVMLIKNMYLISEYIDIITARIFPFNTCHTFLEKGDHDWCCRKIWEKSMNTVCMFSFFSVYFWVMVTKRNIVFCSVSFIWRPWYFVRVNCALSGSPGFWCLYIWRKGLLLNCRIKGPCSFPNQMDRPI